jgi:hypothetical protein
MPDWFLWLVLLIVVLVQVAPILWRMVGRSDALRELSRERGLDHVRLRPVEGAKLEWEEAVFGRLHGMNVTISLRMMFQLVITVECGLPSGELDILRRVIPEPHKEEFASKFAVRSGGVDVTDTVRVPSDVQELLTREKLFERVRLTPTFLEFRADEVPENKADLDRLFVSALEIALAISREPEPEEFLSEAPALREGEVLW